MSKFNKITLGKNDFTNKNIIKPIVALNLTGYIKRTTTKPLKITIETIPNINI